MTNNKISSSRTGIPNPVDIYVGEKLKERRKLLGLSQTELADMLALSFQQIQKYEKGKNAVSVHNELKLAEFLNCDRNYFIQPITESGYKFLTKRGNGHDNQE